MKIRDCREILRWTFLSGVLTFASVGARTAWSGFPNDNVRPPATVTVGGCEYTLQQTVDAKAAIVRGILTVANKGLGAAKLDVSIASIDQTFKGNPASRAFNPRDFSEEVVAKTDATVTVPASGTRTMRFCLKFDPVKTDPTPTAGLLDRKGAGSGAKLDVAPADAIPSKPPSGTNSPTSTIRSIRATSGRPLSVTTPMIAVSVGGKRVMLSAVALPRPVPASR